MGLHGVERERKQAGRFDVAFVLDADHLEDAASLFGQRLDPVVDGRNLLDHSLFVAGGVLFGGQAHRLLRVDVVEAVLHPGVQVVERRVAHAAVEIALLLADLAEIDVEQRDEDLLHDVLGFVGRTDDAFGIERRQPEMLAEQGFVFGCDYGFHAVFDADADGVRLQK